jgi:hypothetical protein
VGRWARGLTRPSGSSCTTLWTLCVGVYTGGRSPRAPPGTTIGACPTWGGAFEYGCKGVPTPPAGAEDAGPSSAGKPQFLQNLAPGRRVLPHSVQNLLIAAASLCVDVEVCGSTRPIVACCSKMTPKPPLPALYLAKKHIHRMTRGGTQECMVYLTLVSSCVQRRLGAELSTSSEDRRTIVRARRASFGASSSGWKEVERASECRDASAKKHTHDTAQRSDGGGRNARTQARRGSLIC